MATTKWSKSVLTFLTPAEQQRVDAAGRGCYTTVHCENFDQLLTDLRSHSVSAVLVSVARYEQQQHAGQVARMVREFPGVPAVALLGAADARHATHAVLQLGHQGVRTLVDVREPSGWRDLRQLVADENPDSIEAVARQQLHIDLQDAVPACRRFFDMLFSAPRSLSTVRELTRSAGVMPTTFMSRFFRARIPAPKKYLAMARLVRAARLFENPGYSITQVAFLLDYSSPQSFSRHVQNTLDVSAAHFRRTHTGIQMLDHFRATLVQPYRDQLLTFDPFHSPPPWISAPTPTHALTRPN
ncbi:MAG: helix-turn-helix domain-containing protein [Gemmatimonadaceae bacterium]|nr:helix-turn-helix domain-containing protein [Gemmatimonadaceae bacterium]